jgi:hypothetical protein
MIILSWSPVLVFGFVVNDISISIGVLDIVTLVDLDFSWYKLLEEVIKVLIASSDHGVHAVLHLKTDAGQEASELPELVGLGVLLDSLKHVCEVLHDNILEISDEHVLDLVKYLMSGRLLDVLVLVNLHHMSHDDLQS